jgi:hypothetical protein
VAKTEIKKVKAFPFPITVKVANHVVNGQVVKMTGTGLMVETTSALLSVGDTVEGEFALPVMKDVISCTGLVVKLFNQLTGAGGLRIAEIHFKLLPDNAREKIHHYLAAVGAKS